jgi:hypothetical protein
MKLFKVKELFGYVADYGLHEYLLRRLLSDLGYTDDYKTDEALVPTSKAVRVFVAAWWFFNDDEDNKFTWGRLLDRLAAWEKLGPYVSDYGALVEAASDASAKIPVGVLTVIDDELYGISGMTGYYDVRTGKQVTEEAEVQLSKRTKRVNFNLYAVYKDWLPSLEAWVADQQRYTEHLAKLQKIREDNDPPANAAG